MGRQPRGERLCPSVVSAYLCTLSPSRDIDSLSQESERKGEDAKKASTTEAAFGRFAVFLLCACYSRLSLSLPPGVRRPIRSFRARSHTPHRCIYWRSPRTPTRTDFSSHCGTPPPLTLPIITKNTASSRKKEDQPVRESITIQLCNSFFVDAFLVRFILLPLCVSSVCCYVER